ncbi:unnamed protein product [Anisakis simplex]|uniref:Band_3_cyto domain-containing protein n=1 Tax=Anisakis simplex TaxID=6269 RepID=A0A0M3K787_ANISI|nr:unnamed protein product [Anisakis simplex]
MMEQRNGSGVRLNAASPALITRPAGAGSSPTGRSTLFPEEVEGLAVRYHLGGGGRFMAGDEPPGRWHQAEDLVVETVEVADISGRIALMKTAVEEEVRDILLKLDGFLFLLESTELQPAVQGSCMTGAKMYVKK